MTPTADPSIIRDQREMIGTDRHDSVSAVEDAWETWGLDMGFVYRRRRGDNSRDLRESSKVVLAYISGGKWVADCPTCNGGIAAWVDNPRGACLDCGTIYDVKFPPAADVAEAIDVLSARPDPLTRSWLVQKGETVADLIAENERYLVEPTVATGAVRADDVARVLGDRAVEKLRAEGVL